LGTALNRAGSNRKALESFLQSYPKGSLEAHAASFLVRNLPLQDAAILTAEDLRTILRHAFAARQVTPWGPLPPWEVFLHFVLPHRISQEPYEPWREPLWKSLQEVVKASGTVDQAVVGVWRWVQRHVRYASSSSRDLGPLALLKLGMGRCEELAILMVAALRSIAIPARTCFTPQWQDREGNHGWVEVWVSGRWHPLDPGLPAPRTWPRQGAHAIRGLALALSPVYGIYETPEEVYEYGPAYTLINRTAAYTPAWSLGMRVLDTEGRPLPSAEVRILVPHAGGIAPLTVLSCGPDGTGSVTLGWGKYLLSSSQKGATTFEWVELGKTHPDVIVLDLSRPRGIEGTFPPESGSTGACARSKSDEEEPGPERHHEAALDPKDRVECPPGTWEDEAALAHAQRRRLEALGFTYPDQLFRDYVLSQRIHNEPCSPWRKELQEVSAPLREIPLQVVPDRIASILGRLRQAPRHFFSPPMTPGAVLTGGWFARPEDAAILGVALFRSLGIPSRFVPESGMVRYRLGKDWADLHIIATDPPH